MFLTGPRVETKTPFNKTRSLMNSAKIFFGIFILLVVSLLLAGHSIYQRYNRTHRSQVEQQLSSIANLKIAELRQWRNERLGDAEMLHSNFNLASSVHQFINHSENKQAKEDLQKWFHAYSSHYDYNQVRLFDTQGNARMVYPIEEAPTPNEVLKQIPEVIHSKRIIFVDLYKYDYDRQIYLSILVPILARSNQNLVIGVISLRVNPKKWLYPIILNWPTWSKTGETLLVRRDGDDALILNETKFAENPPLNVRIPLTNVKFPAVAAVLGSSGIVSGSDYSGTPVITDIHAVPDTPWFLVVKMSSAEAYSSMRPYLFGLVALIASVIFGLTMMLIFLWRRRSAEFYRREFQATELIKENEAKLRAVFESSMDAIGVSKAGVHMFANPAYLKQFGFKDNEQIVGTPITNCIAASHRSELLENVNRRAKREPAPTIYESRGLRSDGTEFDMEISVSTFEFGGEVYSVASLRDITDRKRYQEGLLAAKLAAERTLEAKSRFLDLAAHELRTPVTAISLLLGLAQKQSQKGQTFDNSALTRLQDPVNRLTRLVVDLLDVSRLERGLLLLEPVRTNIVTLILNCIEEFQLQFPNRRITFIKPANTIEMEIDPLRVNQVLSNLLDNATKYTPNDTPIEVEIEAKINTIRISVIDHGPGITKEQQAELFTPFIRGRSDKVIRTSGLGLGLSLCNQIVKLHGGTIAVSSKEGHGSTFYFELPRAFSTKDS